MRRSWEERRLERRNGCKMKKKGGKEEKKGKGGKIRSFFIREVKYKLQMHIFNTLGRTHCLKNIHN